MTFEEIITQFDLKSDTFKVEQMMPSALYLDVEKYNYYIKLLQVQFTNVVPNVKQDLYINIGGSDILIAPKGVYENQQLVDAYNDKSGSNHIYGELSFNTMTGKMQLNNNSGGALAFTNLGDKDFMTNSVIGFDASQLTSVSINSNISANNFMIIQDFNYFVLTSQNIMGNTYTGDETTTNNQMKIENILYTFSSAIKPFNMKTWTAIMPMLFKIDASSFQYISFQLRTGKGEEITDTMGQADFHVLAQMVRQKKI